MKFRHKKLCAGTMSSGTTYKAGGFSLRHPIKRSVRKGSRCYFNVAAADKLQRGAKYTLFLLQVHYKFKNNAINH